MKFKKLFVCLVLSLSLSSLQAEERTILPDDVLDEAFITYANSGYFPLVEVLLESVKAFSSHPIVVFGINDDVPFSTDRFPFMVKKRIDIDNLQHHDIIFAKPLVIENAGVRRGVFVDADVILNEGCDVLFKYCDYAINYPLCPIFPWEVNYEGKLMQILNVTKKTMPYVHLPLVVFNESCKPFIQEWVKYTGPEYRPFAPCFDETVFNVLLWKHGVENWYFNLCDPYYALAYDYLSGGKKQHVQHGYKNWIGKIDFYLFHGCKEAEEARKILNLLIERRSASSL